MSLTGWATSEGTFRYRDRFSSTAAQGHFRDAQGLSLSSIGIGTYLGNPNEATDKMYAEAVWRAVQLGANVIDTAANYRFQRSERSIGQALRTLSQENEFRRDQIIICTKGGYLPFDGAPPRDVRSYIEDTFVRPGIADFDDFAGGSHCMTPSYLENQIRQSLRNMDLDCLDVYYVHNPESQLGFIAHDEFYLKLRNAFEFLEKSRAAGTIRMYGVATWNGFRVSPDSREYHSLPRMVALAREVAGEAHGFRFIQLPFNLAMPEPLTLRNQVVNGQQVSVVEAAASLDITVISSASILQGRVASGLPANIREPLGFLRTDAQTAIQFVRSAPGITTALVGMRDIEHVVENLELATVDPLPAEKFLNAFP
jgi:aryl-alcohol dehydrogenase-like predicted oxidoreductase